MNKDKPCTACKHCYMDMNMDFICGHPDAGEFGKFIRVATKSDGHCGINKSKFEQHPNRNEDGTIIQ